MTGEQVEAVVVVAAGIGARFAWVRWRIRYHARARDYHENALYQLLRRFW